MQLVWQVFFLKKIVSLSPLAGGGRAGGQSVVHPSVPSDVGGPGTPCALMWWFATPGPHHPPLRLSLSSLFLSPRPTPTPTPNHRPGTTTIQYLRTPPPPSPSPSLPKFDSLSCLSRDVCLVVTHRHGTGLMAAATGTTTTTTRRARAHVTPRIPPLAKSARDAMCVEQEQQVPYYHCPVDDNLNIIDRYDPDIITLVTRSWSRAVMCHGARSLSPFSVVGHSGQQQRRRSCG